MGSHWCDLLEFLTGERITALSARLVTAIADRASGPVTTDDIATLSFEATGGLVGTAVMSQVSPGRKNRLAIEVSGLEGSIAFDQEEPERLWVGGLEANQILLRDPATASPAAAPYSSLPAGHPQGYQDCFTHFVADTAAAIAGSAVDGLPTFADGRRAAALAEAVRGLGRQRRLGRGGRCRAGPRRRRRPRGGRHEPRLAKTPAATAAPTGTPSSRCGAWASRSRPCPCSTTSASTCGPARSMPSWARTGPASRP